MKRKNSSGIPLFRTYLLHEMTQCYSHQFSHVLFKKLIFCCVVISFFEKLGQHDINNKKEKHEKLPRGLQFYAVSAP